MLDSLKPIRTEQEQIPWNAQAERPLRLLVIDDDRVCRTLLAHACEAAGHFCESYADPVMAMRAYARESRAYDAVLTDLMMPEMDGLQVLQGVKAVNAAAPVIIISGCSDFNTVLEAIRHRVYSFFLKPFDIREVLAALDRAGRELEAERQRQLEQELLLKEYVKLKRDFGEAQVLLRRYETRMMESQVKE